MPSRRRFCSLALTITAGARIAAQTPPARPPVRELARHALTGPHAGMEAVLVEVTAPPGATATAASTAHRHPGFVLGYVLEGDMRFAIDGREPQTVTTGRTFFEPLGALHTTGGSARPDAGTRFLAFMVVPTGSQLTRPA